MVHLFELMGKKLAYDSECSSIYSLDELSYRILVLYREANGLRPCDEKIGQVCESIQADRKEGIEICDSFDELIDREALFAPKIKAGLSVLYPDSPKIKAMCLHICHDCNMRCRYCFAGTGDYGTHHRSMLSVSTGKKAIDFLIAASGDRHHLDIDFFGGEPLMNWNVVRELTQYCEMKGEISGKDIRLTITTNALLLDKEKTDFINEHMKNCVLSIDGRPEVHNRMRPGIGGKPTYQPISENIRRFIKARESEPTHHKEYYVRGTFTRLNTDFSEDVRHIAQELGARHVSMEPVVSAPGTGYEIRTQDLEAIKTEYERLAEYIDQTRLDGRPIHFFHFHMDFEGGPCVYKRLKGCGVGSEYCAVTPEGDIYPCHQFVGEKNFLMGNVSDLDKITDDNGDLLTGHSVENILDPNVRKIFSDRLLPNRPECEICFARYHCGGGCAANRYFSTGSLDKEYEIGCSLIRKRLECSIWLACVKSEREV
ncbi:MAG: thioether cross-link-forming SCIFF peptide maturase [Clostridiaceae bacterium]|nr:thioether cross-link-forming SCIFF peptide maturase [Clostridiaceae bacterium]